ncbi:MAG TPA: aromatic ring-hydroxylating dioxygenase subunit alpha [Candidatus Krumholzibacteria bacterium]|nr:aromatic ring-hydroxylating dioxygenase subunit alpha [Candidatus Krumholzibacteria bacterium]
MRSAMNRPLDGVIADYDAEAALENASTIPAPWYVDPRVYDLERRSVFGGWQMVGRLDQVAEPGQYFTAEVAGEPLVVVRGRDGVLRAFFNVCRHHAALVMTEPQGRASVLRCPYHGWTYSLEGELKGTPDFDGVCNFERSRNGLVPVRLETWEQFVFVHLNDAGGSLAEFLGDLVERVQPLAIGHMRFVERRTYAFDSNWKVFVDNYLDGGYHIPFLHKGLHSVLELAEYRIENGAHYCLQSSPVRDSGRDEQTAAVRKGKQAYYYWLYPNFMFNWYEGVLDTNLVLPLGIDRTLVVFDFYFDDVEGDAAEKNRASIQIGERIQDEDTGICASVQKGLGSRAYNAGRLSVRREAGEHLFHRLLARDLRRALATDSL